MARRQGLHQVQLGNPLTAREIARRAILLGKMARLGARKGTFRSAKRYVTQHGRNGARGGTSKIQQGFVAHVEKQVEYAKVGNKTVLALIHLVIPAGRELRVGQRVLRADNVAEVCHAGQGVTVCRNVPRSRLDVRFNTD